MKITFKDQDTQFEIACIQDAFENSVLSAASLTAALVSRLRKQHRNSEIQKVVAVIKDILKDLPSSDREEFLHEFAQANR